jgi:hypothetical protein
LILGNVLTRLQICPYACPHILNLYTNLPSFSLLGDSTAAVAVAGFLPVRKIASAPTRDTEAYMSEVTIRREIAHHRLFRRASKSKLMRQGVLD